MNTAEDIFIVEHPESFLIFQERNDLCWAATMQMLCKINGISFTQEQWARQIHNPEVADQGINVKLQDTILNSSYNTFKIERKSEFKITLPNDEALIKSIESHQAIVASYNVPNQNTAHTILIIGVNYNSSNATINEIIALDPYPSRGLTRESYQYFRDCNVHFWYPKITRFV